jgi:hypothetical protein
MATILERNKKVKAPEKTREEYAEDALYREVWEDVNNEKTQRFLKKYARQLIAGALAIMIIVVGIQLWRHHYHASRLATAQNYEMAVSNRDANALAALFDNGSGSMADLALYQSYLLDKDESKLEKLAAHGNTTDFRDIAILHLAGIRGDKMTVEDFKKFINPLLTRGSPFYYNGMLMLAQKYLAANDNENAAKWLDKIINDKNAPDSIMTAAATLK